MPTELRYPQEKCEAQAETQTLITIVLVWFIICLGFLGTGAQLAVDLFKHAPHHAARRLAARALLGRIWGFWFQAW
jgi:hypothetical protein